MPDRRKALGLNNQNVSDVQFGHMVRAHEDLVAGRRGGARLIARFMTARGQRCDRRQLQDSDFTGADLASSTFIGANLQRASFYCANLTGCDFRGAVMQRIDLRGSKLTAAKLSGARLDEADMRAAVLCVADDLRGLTWLSGSARFAGASLLGADLEEAQAFAVDFSDCSLRKVRLCGANLKNAVFTNADLDGADLRGARLEGATFRGAILTGVNLATLGIPQQALTGAILEPSPEACDRLNAILAALEQAEAWVGSNGRAGRPANLDGLDLRPANPAFAGRQLVATNARNAIAVGMDFSGAQMPGSNFDNADLRGANFKDADLRGASFRNAKLSHASFLNADTSPLPLNDGRSRPARFDGARLEGTGLARRAHRAFLD